MFNSRNLVSKIVIAIVAVAVLGFVAAAILSSQSGGSSVTVRTVTK